MSVVTMPALFLRSLSHRGQPLASRDRVGQSCETAGDPDAVGTEEDTLADRLQLLCNENEVEVSKESSVLTGSASFSAKGNTQLQMEQGLNPVHVDST